ncbi:hypothetical protein B9Z55_017316 [Caenorhabditis nigoni]|uniref:NR LBD domain-containing protein n=1 Tax=Caenorhabditis nigoni TaxID=1611254 RepID=A0A2G5T969_9PELO|nr:hypothetical protein B9Z55_017316 [Caenorhabditis nigoni]
MGMTVDAVDQNVDDKELDEIENDELEPKKSPFKLSDDQLRTEYQFYQRSIHSPENSNSIHTEIYKIFKFELPKMEAHRLAGLGPIAKFKEGLRLIRSSQKTNDLKIDNRFSRTKLIFHWKRQARTIAYLLIHSFEFRYLELDEKMKKFRICWKSVYRLERILATVEIFGRSCITEKFFVLSNEIGIRINDLDVEGIEGSSRATRNFQKYAKRLLKDVAEPLIELKLSMEEQSFLMLNFLLFLEDIPDEDSIETQEEFLEILTDDLHEYYMEHGITNYSLRILKITKIVWAMKRIHEDDMCGEFAK